MRPFVGRQPELVALRAKFTDAARGQPQIVLIQGPAGIGKTALVERFLSELVDSPAPTVIRASGEETEVLLPYGVIHQLARYVGAAGSNLLAAISPGDALLDDPVTVGTRLLELLDTVESVGPVVLVLDDVHWADQSSLKAVIFALRRLVADQVLVLMTAGDDAVAELPESLRRLVSGRTGSVLRLRGLDEEDLRDLAEEMGIGGFASAAARRLRYGTQGNPLHARALLEEFPPGEWGASDRPLPSPRSFRVLVQDRYEALDEDARRLVDAAAVLAARSPLPLAAALGEVADPVQALDAATKRDLLAVSTAQLPWTVSFPHPLVRSAVLDAFGPARRLDLHASAARLVEDETLVLHHRVAAAVGADDGLAGDLATFASHEAGRQAWPSAAAHLVEAARLTSDRDDAQRRLLTAVSWMLETGDVARAADYAEEVRTYSSSPLRDRVLGSLALGRGDPGAAEELLRSAWEGCGDGTELEVAATVALQNGVHFFGRLDASASVEWCRRALALTSLDSETRQRAVTYLAHGLGYGGHARDAYATVGAAEPYPGDPGFSWLQPRSARGLLRLVDDDLDGARADLAAVAAAASELGILNTAAYGFAVLARAEYVAGAWDDAVLHAERAIAVNVESASTFIQSMVHGVAALVPSARGEWVAAHAFLADVPVRYPGDYERSVVAVGLSRATLADAQGDYHGVVSALEPILAFPTRDAVDEPGFWAWADLYADALVGLGRYHEADRLLVPHEELAARRGRRSSIARLARARGRVEAAAGRPDRAEAAFTMAMDTIAQVPVPFEQARIQLAAGQFLRRLGQRRRAADLLGAAQEQFGALGAEPWAERCAKELAASGLHPATRSNRHRAGLTSQELVVARLAAAGRTNREVASELVVSIKTVEYHLRNAYQKLGISRRRQLAGRLAQLPAG